MSTRQLSPAACLEHLISRSHSDWRTLIMSQVCRRQLSADSCQQSEMELSDTHSHVHTLLLSPMHVQTHACMPYARTRTRACRMHAHARAHALCTHTHAHAHTHTHTHSRTHTYSHSQTRVHTHACTHTHTETHDYNKVHKTEINHRYTVL